MKVALMTAIVGGIDERKIIPEQSIFVDELFFDDGNCGFEGLDYSDRQKALFFKTQGHHLTDADIIIWVDGKIQINSSDFAEQCVSALGLYDLAIMKHLYRKCIYEEVDHIEHCIKHGNEYLATRYAHRPIREQVEYYREKGYPVNNGLNDCCIICRRNNYPTNKLFDEWWTSCKQDLFDQTAIQYLAWKRHFKIQPIVFRPGSFTDTPHVKLQ